MAENGFISYAARLSYNYGQRYYIQASVRRDGLSSLPTANKYGTFPGLSLGWTVSNEVFMESLKQTISNLRVRASYGKVGNTDIGNYAYCNYTEPQGMQIIMDLHLYKRVMIILDGKLISKRI